MSAQPSATSKPEFQDMHPIELPKIILIADFLTGSYGGDIFREAKDRAQKKYGNARPLLVANYLDGVVQGSNPFYAVLVNEIVRNQELRTANPADIERMLRAGDRLGIKNKYYVDTALVLRSKLDSDTQNDPLSRDLFKQVRNRRLRLPIMIPLNSLDLKVDPNNQYGLGFTIREDAQLVYAPVLNKPGRFNSEDINPDTGLPNKTNKEGSRQLLTRKEGLSRLYLYWGLGLGSFWGSLGKSGADGRMVLCDKVACDKKLDILLR